MLLGEFFFNVYFIFIAIGLLCAKRWGEKYKKDEDITMDFFSSVEILHRLYLGGTHKRQISKPPTPHPPVSISASNHYRQSQRLGKVRLG